MMINDAQRRLTTFDSKDIARLQIFIGDQLGESTLAIENRLENAEGAYGALRSVLWVMTQFAYKQKSKGI